MNQLEINELFEDYLYPIIRWSHKRNGLYYNSSKIHMFKGIKTDNTFAYAIQYKACHLFIEEFNAKNYVDLIDSDKLKQFLLTSPVIAGRRFFEYISHYFELKKKIEHFLDAKFTKEELPDGRIGDRYVKALFIASLMMMVDRFDDKVLENNSIVNILYTWAYSLRLVMYAVYKETINSYAIGTHERINQISLFEWISDMTEPSEIEHIELNKLKDWFDKYPQVKERIEKINIKGFIEDGK